MFMEKWKNTRRKDVKLIAGNASICLSFERLVTLKLVVIFNLSFNRSFDVGMYLYLFKFLKTPILLLNINKTFYVTV